MAPDIERVEKQTSEILRCLFDDSDVTYRNQGSGDIEHDGPEDFDVVLVADKLREIADALNRDAEFQAKLSALKKQVAQEALDEALRSGIDSLVQTQVGQRAEVAPELHLIKATLAFGLYMKKTCPDLKAQLQTSIGNFLNQRVGPWIAQQGGWGKVADASKP